LPNPKVTEKEGGDCPALSKKTLITDLLLCFHTRKFKLLVLTRSFLPNTKVTEKEGRDCPLIPSLLLKNVKIYGTKPFTTRNSRTILAGTIDTPKLSIFSTINKSFLVNGVSVHSGGFDKRRNLPLL
jgi:hypothetical protein